MIVDAPAAIAFVRSPEYLMPPSAMIGTLAFAAAFEHSAMAVNCGTPAPATIRVVQIDPGPTPTLSPSAPAAIRSRTASFVAMLPATTSMSGNLCLRARTVSITPVL